MKFTHAFVALPSCAPGCVPSRAALLIGLMPARNGAEDNHTYPKPQTRYLLSHPRDVDYVCRDQLGPDHVFVHTSDHESQWPFGKWTLFDYGIPVPLIIAWPDMIEAGVRSEAMVQWTDLIPTLLELAGGEVPPVDSVDDGIDGRSFAPVLLGKSTSHRNEIFTTHTGDKGVNVYPSRAVRTREWKRIHNLHPEFAFANHSDLYQNPGAGAYWKEWMAEADANEAAKAIVDRYYARPEWELYRVGQDRWERSNLAESAEHREILDDLKSRLDAWMKAQGDQRHVFHAPRLLSEPKRWKPWAFPLVD